MGRNCSVGVASLVLLTLILFSSFTLGSMRNTSQGTMQSRNQVTTQSLGDFYWKPSFTDYVLSGMPDFDQRQWGTYNWSYLGSWSHCGPVAVADSLWWLDSEFESSPANPSTPNDHFPLVRAYGGWDDHDPQNVPWLVEHLAFLMDTNGMRTHQAHSGTNVNDMEAGLTQYLSWTGVNPPGDVNGDGIVDGTDLAIVNAAMGSHAGGANWNLAADIFPASTGYPPFADNIIDQNDLNLVQGNMGRTGLFNETKVAAPNFNFIENQTERCHDVVLLLDFWTWTGSSWYHEGELGHFVTVAGVDSLDSKLAISDPTQDAYETGTIPEGRVPIPHVHQPPEPPYVTHNNASLVSQDEYSVVNMTAIGFPGCPAGNWALMNYSARTPPQFAVISNVVVTSPSGTRDVAVTNITKQFPFAHENSSMQINVTVANHGNYAETFNVTAYVNATIIYTAQNVIVASEGSRTIVFTWYATEFALGNYTISAYAWPVCDEKNTADNTYVDGTVPLLDALPSQGGGRNYVC